LKNKLKPGKGGKMKAEIVKTRCLDLLHKHWASGKSLKYGRKTLFVSKQGGVTGMNSFKLITEKA